MIPATLLSIRQFGAPDIVIAQAFHRRGAIRSPAGTADVRCSERPGSSSFTAYL